MSTRFGDWLKMERLAKGMTQGQLEEEADLGFSYVSKVERGRTKLPESETRARIHKALGTSDDDLVEMGILVAMTRDGRVTYVPSDDVTLLEQVRGSDVSLRKVSDRETIRLGIDPADLEAGRWSIRQASRKIFDLIMDEGISREEAHSLVDALLVLRNTFSSAEHQEVDGTENSYPEFEPSDPREADRDYGKNQE